MKRVLSLSVFLILIMTLANCKKKTQPSSREEQIEKEISQPLLANEILEQEGIRFILNYDPSQAQLGLNLYKGSSDAGTLLVPYQPYVNYYIEAESLQENSDYIMSVVFNNITASGSYTLSVIGFTDLNKSKVFLLDNLNYTVANNQGSKPVLKIRKGIRKFGFYKL